MKELINVDNIIKQITDKIKFSKKTAIITHIRPDGDALGSTLALKQFAQKYCEVSVFCDDVIPPKYSFLPDAHYLRSDFFNINDYDLLISVDCSDLNRIGKYSQLFSKHKNTINVDHHISNERFGDINLVLSTSSNCEIILKIIEKANVEVSRDMAICLYCGLSSDTGNFSHSNTTFETLANGASLCKIIGDISFINQNIYKEMPLGRVKLLGHIINKNMKLFLEDRLCILYASIDDIKNCQCNVFDTEGIVDYAINIKGVEVGLMILQSDNNAFKVSLRSKRADVCKIASEFGGGGHIHASGCMLFGDIDSIITKLVNTTEFYIANL